MLKILIMIIPMITFHIIFFLLSTIKKDAIDLNNVTRSTYYKYQLTLFFFSCPMYLFVRSGSQINIIKSITL